MTETFNTAILLMASYHNRFGRLAFLRMEFTASPPSRSRQAEPIDGPADK